MMSIQQGKPNLKHHSTLNMREAVIRLEVKYTFKYTFSTSDTSVTKHPTSILLNSSKFEHYSTSKIDILLQLVGIN